MDYNMALILAILTLIAIVLLLAASYGDGAKTKHEQFQGIGFGTSNDIQQEMKLNQLVKSISGLEQLLTPIVDLIQKHEDILSGAKSKGDLGEQFVEEKLADLPHSWYDRKVPFRGGIADFALRVPKGRWIPIDSQWTATDLLVKLRNATEQSQRNSLRMDAHQAVSIRAREAMKYLDREITLGFCIVAVPDPVFELCVDMQARLTTYNIVLISYSLLVPYILIIVDQFLRTPESAQTLQISHILSRSAAQIEEIQKYINKEVVPPLYMVSRQQTQHVRRNQGLEQAYIRLNQIQNQLNELKNMINPVPNSEIISIPESLQRRLNLVRDGLLEGVAKQNGNKPNSADN